MAQISGDNRRVPRRQREQIVDRIDNYIDNHRRHGDPNLTDETDVFEILHEEDKRINKELRDNQSIQRWNK